MCTAGDAVVVIYQISIEIANSWNVSKWFVRQYGYAIVPKDEMHFFFSPLICILYTHCECLFVCVHKDRAPNMNISRFSCLLYPADISL